MSAAAREALAGAAGNGAGRLRDAAWDPELDPGARNAVFTCLAVRPGESCLLITDEDTLPIGAALAAQFRQATDRFRAFVLEDVAPRPLERFPEPIARAMEAADVTCYAASARRGELRARMQMTEIVDRRRIRHAHMVAITERIMTEGMRADFLEVDALSRWALERARRAREIRVTSPAGTDLSARFSPALRWVKTSGLISAEAWGNLPGGEIFTCPAGVDGVYVCDGVLGDWFAAVYGDLRGSPVSFRIAGARVVGVECARDDLRRDVEAYIATDENSSRVGEFALGTNLAVTNVIGHILQDEKMPGVHVAFGHPYREHTGADWTSGTHVDAVGRECDVWIDDLQVIRRGRYLVDPAELPRAPEPAPRPA
ncbi:MAG TPA: aminopeptidase [Gemmatimonadota bacterium]